MLTAELRHWDISGQQTCIMHKVHTIHSRIFTVWCFRSSRPMDKKLRELNLGTLVDRFHAEKIEPDNVISASDSELTRLGVSTIGALLNFDIENQNADLWGEGCERNPLHPPGYGPVTFMFYHHNYCWWYCCCHYKLLLLLFSLHLVHTES